MPVERVEKINNDNLIAIWRLNETAEELLSLYRLSEDEQLIFDKFVNEKRKKEWLAYRTMLKVMLGKPGLVIFYDEYRKPHLKNANQQISVAHSADLAAVIISNNSPVGIDIERITPRIDKIRKKFLNPDELGYLTNNYSLEELYIYWGAKEALYKMYGRKLLDFRKNMHLDKVTPSKKGNFKGRIIHDALVIEYNMKYEIFDDYVMVYVIENDNKGLNISKN